MKSIVKRPCANRRSLFTTYTFSLVTCTRKCLSTKPTPSWLLSIRPRKNILHKARRFLEFDRLESSTLAPAIMAGALPRIPLNDTEQLLRRLLLDVASYHNPSQPSQLRFTGGWVRDKLLGTDSHDIDVGINDMTGYQFGLKMKEYLSQPENPAKYGIQDEQGDSSSSSVGKKLFSGLHKIEANPEKSKHLETVTTKIFGLDIDLVNLRKETYSEDSRNPQMEFGSPEEDALRRDATINAMFYNLQTQQLEDLTERGYHDMQNRIMRTPLEPYQTFKDDPLRVLRLIRFASRLNYRLDEAAEAPIRDDRIRQALKAKISRERIGVEVDKMLRGNDSSHIRLTETRLITVAGPNPHLALSLLDRLGLYGTVFTDPSQDRHFEPDTSSWHFSYDCARGLVGGSSSPLFNLLDLHAGEKSYLLWLLSTVVPWKDAPYPTVSKKPAPPIAYAVIRNGLSAPNRYCDVISAAVKNFYCIIKAKDDFIVLKRRGQGANDSGGSGGRDILGLAIRSWGSSWKSQVSFCIMAEAEQAQESGRGKTIPVSLIFALTFLSLTSSFRYIRRVHELLATYRIA